MIPLSNDVVDYLRGLHQFRFPNEPNAPSTYAKAANEIVQLRRWRAEALQTLKEWEEVWLALGEPGPLGASKAKNALAEIRRLQELAARHHGVGPDDPAGCPGGHGSQCCGNHAACEASLRRSG